MTTQESNRIFYHIQDKLYEMGFDNVKAWVEYKPRHTITALEVYSSPILMRDNIKKIQAVFPRLSITGNTNQSYILIKLQ